MINRSIYLDISVDAKQALTELKRLRRITLYLKIRYLIKKYFCMRTLFKIYFTVLILALPALGLLTIWCNISFWKWSLIDLVLTDLMLIMFGIFSFLALALFKK